MLVLPYCSDAALALATSASIASWMELMVMAARLGAAARATAAPAKAERQAAAGAAGRAERAVPRVGTNAMARG